jgi:hypothetical protein
MPLAFERLLIPAAGAGQSPVSEGSPRLEVSVIFTSVEATLAALRKAGALASELRAGINLIVPQVVPFPLPLTSPPVLLDFNERRFHVLAGRTPVDTTVRIYLCRDGPDAVKAALQPKSLVVVGGRKCWWPTREKALVRRLRRAGHEVVFAATSL